MRAFKKLDVIWSAEAGHTTSNFLKAVFHKFYLVHSWILCPRYNCNVDEVNDDDTCSVSTADFK